MGLCPVQVATSTQFIETKSSIELDMADETDPTVEYPVKLAPLVGLFKGVFRWNEADI
jgi:hypothetical protein